MINIIRNASCRPLARQAFRALYVQNPKRNYFPTRYDPFHEFQNSVDRFFRDFERSTPSFRSFFRQPLARAVPIETNDNGQRLFKIEIDLPDFKPEDIQITVKKGEVSINAKNVHSDGDFKQHREFSYRYSLPEDADIDKVRSVLKTDGRLVLEAPLPQLKQNENKEIPIQKQ